MDVSLNSKHLGVVARHPLLISLLIIAAFVWLMMDRVITREDQILEQGARIERGQSEMRVEMASGFQALQNAIETAADAEDARSAELAEAVDRLGRLSAAQCYLDADSPEDERRCAEADVGPARLAANLGGNR